MLHTSYFLKLINDKDEIVKIIPKYREFTEEEITEILLEHQEIAMYCELSIRKRLDTSLLNKYK